MISSQTRAERYKRYAEAVLSISLARTVPASIDVPARRPCIAPRPHATAPTVVARPILSVANRFLTMDPHGLVSISRQFSRQHLADASRVSEMRGTMWRLTVHHCLLRFSLWSSSADDHGHVTFASRHSQCKILRLTSFSPRILYKMLLPAPWWWRLWFRQVTLLAGPRFQFAVPTTGCCMSMWTMRKFQFDQG